MGQIQEIIRLFHNLYCVFLILFGVGMVSSILMFVLLDIKNVFNTMTGRTAGTKMKRPGKMKPEAFVKAEETELLVKTEE